MMKEIWGVAANKQLENNVASSYLTENPAAMLLISASN